MNFGCHADVFQLPHHRQYLFVGCYSFSENHLPTRLQFSCNFIGTRRINFWTITVGVLPSFGERIFVSVLIFRAVSSGRDTLNLETFTVEVLSNFMEEFGKYFTVFGVLYQDKAL